MKKRPLKQIFVKTPLVRTLAALHVFKKRNSNKSLVHLLDFFNWPGSSSLLALPSHLKKVIRMEVIEKKNCIAPPPYVFVQIWFEPSTAPLTKNIKLALTPPPPQSPTLTRPDPPRP